MPTWPPSLADVKTNTNITASTDDAEIQTFIDRAVAILENLPGYRVIDGVKQTTYTAEEHDGGDATVYLDHYPVVSVTSVSECTPTAQAIAAEPWGTATYTGYGYRLKADRGRLTRLSGGLDYPWQGTVLVTYVAGVSTPDPALWGAALDLTAHLWETQRGDQGPLTSGLEDVQGFTDDRLLPSRVREALAPYRKAPALA